MAKPTERSATTESAVRKYPRLLLRFQRLLDLTANLASTFDLETLLQRIVVAARELTDSEASSLLLYDQQTHSLYFEAATGALIDGVGQRAVPADDSIAGWVFTHGQPLLSDDVMNDQRFFREIDALTRFQTRSILGVPLKTKDKVLGVIESVNKLQGRFDEEDVQILQTLAAQAAIAIENSQLFKQSDLIAEIVHELRTPLASLTAASHLLQRPELSPERHRALTQTILSEVRRLNDLATDFLELSRLESGRVRIVREPVHLGGLVQECLEVVRPQAQAKQIEPSTEVDPSVAPLHGDRTLLKQLLLNLLTNAIKYNKVGGRVVVAIRPAGDLVEMSVQDTGRGIAPTDLPHLFERFYRVREVEGEVPGTGLGLAIARRIAESHQGSIRVESQPAQGSTFFVYLPADGAPQVSTRPRG